jgi:hypothetical protein
MMTRKTITVLAVLALTCGATALSSASAPAAIVHEYEREISEKTVPSLPKPSSKSFLPFGVAVDNSASPSPSAGNVYVSDFENGVVDRFDPVGAYVSQLTGFSIPWGIAVDNSTSLSAEGGLYVGDYGSSDLYKGKSLCASGLTGVTGVAVDQATGDVYVARGESSEARNTKENLVYKFDSSCTPLAPLEGFRRPTAVAVDNTCYYAGLTGSACTSADPPNGDVYVLEAGGNQLLSRFDATGKLLSQWHAEGFGLTVDQSSGDVYVAENSANLVQEFDRSGTLLAEIGATSPNYPTGARTKAFEPLSVAVDRVSHEIYVADIANGVVDVFEPPAESPEAFTGPFSNLQPTSVTLEGEVNPKHADTTSWFEYGPCAKPTCTASDPYTFKQSTVQSPTGPSPGSADDGNGTANVPVQASITGLLPNQPYHYRLIAKSKNGEVAGAEQQFATPAIAPTGETLPPAFVGFQAAALSGSVNPEHSDTTYRFEYGQCTGPAACPASGYTSVTPAQKSAVYGVVGAFQEIEGLQPSSTYHYRLVASSSAGASIVNGPPEVTFTTEPAPALVVATGAAGGVTQTSAMISGTLDPNGLASSYGFQIGTQAGVYGPEVGVGRVELGIFETRSVTLALQNLQPGTTYHYRLVASNAYNASVYGADQMFTTAGASSPFTQPLTSPLLATPAIVFPLEVKVKKLTQAQQLARALKVCAKKSKSKRAACRRAAHRKYGTKPKKKK